MLTCKRPFWPPQMNEHLGIVWPPGCWPWRQVFVQFVRIIDEWMMNGLTVHLLVKSADISVAPSLSSSSWDVISLAWLDSVRGYRNTGMQVSFVIFVPAPWLGLTRCHTSSRGIDSHLHAGLPSCLDSCNLQRFWVYFFLGGRRLNRCKKDCKIATIQFWH